MTNNIFQFSNKNFTKILTKGEIIRLYNLAFVQFTDYPISKKPEAMEALKVFYECFERELSRLYKDNN